MEQSDIRTMATGSQPTIFLPHHPHHPLLPLFHGHGQRIQQNKCQSAAHRQKKNSGEDCLCRAYKSGSKFWATTKTQIFSNFFPQFLCALKKIF